MLYAPLLWDLVCVLLLQRPVLLWLNNNARLALVLLAWG